MLTESKWNTLRHEAAKVMALEKLRVATELRLWQYGQRDMPAALVQPLHKALATIKESEDELKKKECAAIAKGTPEAEWLSSVTGCGPSMWYVLGAAPHQPGEYRTVSALWKTFGLHVHDGAAVKRTKGRSGSHQRFNSILRAWILYRVGVSHLNTGCTCGCPIKRDKDDAGHRIGIAGVPGACLECDDCEAFTPKSPYGSIYYDRRVRTFTKTHPPMLDDGEGCATCDRAREITRIVRKSSHQQRDRASVALDCSNVCVECGGSKKRIRRAPLCSCDGRSGVHWTTGHRHADALRVMTKAILRDVYRVWNGQAPKYADGGKGQAISDTHSVPALPAVGEG